MAIHSCNPRAVGSADRWIPRAPWSDSLATRRAQSSKGLKTYRWMVPRAGKLKLVRGLHPCMHTQEHTPVPMPAYTYTNTCVCT